jgi:glutaredoxin
MGEERRLKYVSVRDVQTVPLWSRRSNCPYKRRLPRALQARAVGQNSILAINQGTHYKSDTSWMVTDPLPGYRGVENRSPWRLNLRRSCHLRVETISIPRFNPSVRSKNCREDKQKGRCETSERSIFETSGNFLTINRQPILGSRYVLEMHERLSGSLLA